MTIKSEKIRTYRWLLVSLESGAKFSNKIETRTAAMEIGQELRATIDALEGDDGIAVNFATRNENNGHE